MWESRMGDLLRHPQSITWVYYVSILPIHNNHSIFFYFFLFVFLDFIREEKMGGVDMMLFVCILKWEKYCFGDFTHLHNNNWGMCQFTKKKNWNGVWSHISTLLSQYNLSSYHTLLITIQIYQGRKSVARG